MNNKFIIGIDLGGTNIKAALIDRKFKIKAAKVLSTNKFNSQENLTRGIIGIVKSLSVENGIKQKDILGIGLGLPGPVDSCRGLVHFLPNIPGWKNVALAGILKSKIGVPVFIDNDAKLMTQAEYNFGRAKAAKNALCMTLGTGVGGGLILDGKLFRGRDNAAGEIGHLPINLSGPLCNCGGTACLEAYVGNKRIAAKAKKVFGRDISLEELSRLAKRNHKLALGIWLEAGKQLGKALSGVVNLLNLDVVVIGGGVAQAGEILFKQIRKTIRGQSMSVQAGRVKVLKARLGNNAGLIGAAILVKERLGI